MISLSHRLTTFLIVLAAMFGAHLISARPRYRYDQWGRGGAVALISLTRFDRVMQSYIYFRILRYYGVGAINTRYQVVVSPRCCN